MEEKQKLNKRQVLLIVLGIAILIVLVVGVTYAYFQNQLDDGANANVDVDTDIPDNLVFDVNKDIGITITQFNFGPNAGNQSDSAIASASLTANSTYNTATYTYYVYFKINNNNYVYTTEDNKPEIILTVTDPTGQPVTSIDGLTYNQELGGFDITTANGTFAVASEYTITSNSSVKPTTQNWNFTATFINLDTDQGDNAGKRMDAEIIIQQDELKPTLADWVIEQYAGTQGNNGIYYHDASLANSAQDNSYRYAGANPNNYVCFGSDASTCPAANLYRIIGVFGNEVKIIKNTSYGSYGWNSGGSNTWNSSTKPDIRTTLNTTFLNTLSPTWQNKIVTHAFKVGGIITSQVRNQPSVVYGYEVGSNSSSTPDSMKIGLMYVSDYGYAASSNYWTTQMNFYNNAINNNWMYLGSTEWTISRSSDYSSYAFYVHEDGDVFIDSRYLVGYSRAVRPSFYLESSTSYVSGSGSSADPIRVN